MVSLEEVLGVGEEGIGGSMLVKVYVFELIL